MQTQKYVNYMHYMVLNGSEQKCARFPRNLLPINRHKTCKICTKMTYNVIAGYYRAGQNAQMSILTSEMNSLSQFCYSLMYLMLFGCETCNF